MKSGTTRHNKLGFFTAENSKALSKRSKKIKKQKLFMFPTKPNQR